jgi:hypothetical protein
MGVVLALIALPALIAIFVVASLTVTASSAGAAALGLVFVPLALGVVAGLLRFMRQMDGPELR